MQFALSGFQTRDYEEQALKVLDFHQLSQPLGLTEIDFYFNFFKKKKKKKKFRERIYDVQCKASQDCELNNHGAFGLYDMVCII